jgi:hypothetical protein
LGQSRATKVSVPARRSNPASNAMDLRRSARAGEACNPNPSSAAKRTAKRMGLENRKPHPSQPWSQWTRFEKVGGCSRRISPVFNPDPSQAQAASQRAKRHEPP